MDHVHAVGGEGRPELKRITSWIEPCSHVSISSGSSRTGIRSSVGGIAPFASIVIPASLFFLGFFIVLAADLLSQAGLDAS